MANEGVLTTNDSKRIGKILILQDAHMASFGQ
jgi:hypothetical protein